jgi:hypothetical protein
MPVDEQVLVHRACTNEDDITCGRCAQNWAGELVRSARFNHGDFDIAIF